MAPKKTIKKKVIKRKRSPSPQQEPSTSTNENVFINNEKKLKKITKNKKQKVSKLNLTTAKINGETTDEKSITPIAHLI